MGLSFNQIPAFLVGIALPIVFLALVRALDLYASGSFKTVMVAFIGGLLAFGGAYVVNNAAASRLEPILINSATARQVTSLLGAPALMSVPAAQRAFAVITLAAAPIAEEVLKSIVLIILVRRPNFTYFVDGAIYGFAAGTAFAVLENPFYAMISPAAGVGLMLMRAFSTSLMHGTASALVGVALGRTRFGKGPARIVALVAGWLAAIALHASFNRVVYLKIGGAILPLAVGIGGVILVAAFIFWGLRQERAWLEETLGLKLGVSKGEAAVVLKMEDLDKLLEPIAARFGEEKREQVETFVKYQAQLGIKRKATGMAQDENLRQELEKQITDLRQKMDVLRRQVGVYCMSYVRSILPPESTLIWTRLAEELARERVTDKNLFKDLGQKLDEGASKPSLFSRVAKQ